MVDWRRNLAALWFAEFTAIFGFSFAFPFLSIFLSEDLGVNTGRDLDLWAALAGGASGFAMAFASPIWGVLADRFGRKPMLIRSMIGGGITVGLIYLCQSPEQLVFLRFLQGLTSGTVVAAMALVAAETPRLRVGWAIGVVSSAIALGGAIGPVVGGLAGAVFGLRPVFLGGGILLLAATIPVLVIVRESPRPARDKPRVSALELIKQRPGLVRALAVLIAAQGLVSLVLTASQQLVVLRLIELVGGAAATAATGIAFSAAGITNSASAVGYTAVTRRFGYVPTVTLAAMVLAATIGFLVVAPGAVSIVIAVGVMGLLYGAIAPATASMIGLESPAEVQSTVFGLNASSVALGFAIGPLIGGGVAAGSGVPTAMAVTAGVGVFLALLLALGAREPAR